MKIQTKRYALSALLLFPLLGAGCASTSLQGVWKAPDTGGKVNKVLVIGPNISWSFVPSGEDDD